eukprot:XP_022268418.1 uncharacterized protein LOC111093307 [Canis lupus familiaris]
MREPSDRGSEGTPASPTAPTPGRNSLALCARPSPRTPPPSTPAQPLVPGSDLPPRGQRQGPRSAAPSPLHGQAPAFLALLPPWPAGATLAAARGQGRTPPEGQGTVCAPADSRRAPGAGEGALPAEGGGRSRDARGSAPHAEGAAGRAPFWPFWACLSRLERGRRRGSWFGGAGCVRDFTCLIKRKRQVEGEADSPLSREPGAGLHPRTPGS